LKRPSHILLAHQDSRWTAPVVRLWRAADRYAAAGWCLVRRAAPVGELEPAVSELVRDALEAALLPAGLALHVTGPRANPLRSGLAGLSVDTSPGTAVGAVILVVAGGLEDRAAGEVPAAIAALAADVVALVVLVPVWPDGRRFASSRTRTLRRAVWWHQAAARGGLEPWVELRREAGGHACLVLRPAPEGDRRELPRAAPSRTGLHIRIHDDLSRATSFTWISASIALALEREGVSVSIAPTELTSSIGPARRRALGALIERGRAPAATAEVGWTHFWPEYRRPLGGEHPLALFALNYAFARSDRDGWDPWMRRLIEDSTPLGAISTFCADVLAKAGVRAERLHHVPLAPTEGLDAADPWALPRGRALKLVHVTNATDPLRHGTDVALAAFREAFTPEDDLTFVIRDYAWGNSDLGAQVQRLAGEGYDVRYWPAFYPDHRLGTLLSAFDALVAPFRGEGFGIKLLDAMSCGLPVLAPRFGGPVEFLDESAGYTVPHRLAPVRAGYDADRLALGNEPLWAEVEPGDLAQRLREVRDDPAGLARRGTEARRVATERFSWERTARAVVAAVERGQAGA
jgi:glycosyltransferase involved in cell wall biosynthesis